MLINGFTGGKIAGVETSELTDSVLNGREGSWETDAAKSSLLSSIGSEDGLLLEREEGMVGRTGGDSHGFKMTDTSDDYKLEIFAYWSIWTLRKSFTYRAFDKIN